MSLTNLINFKYLKENLRKSKAIILICLLLIPIFNGILYLISASSVNIYIPEFNNVSTLIMIGGYIIPIVLSITLFSFIYKRKSSDFVLSMPISKGKIFLTNTLGGILVIIGMNLINFIILLFISLIFNNILVNYKMLFDVFLIYSISYIYVFICSNVAVSFTSNRITTVIVTMIFLFLIPFTSTFINTGGFEFSSINDYVYEVSCHDDACKPNNYTCFDKVCKDNVEKGIYEVSLDGSVLDNYNMPFQLILFNVFKADYSKINNSAIGVLIICLLYSVVGYVLFKNKKFDVVDTSFGSLKLHVIVRGITTFPILCLYYLICKDLTFSVSSIFMLCLLFALLIAYLIIYDLITRRKITRFSWMILSTIIVSIIVILLPLISKNVSRKFDVSDIKYITSHNDRDYSGIKFENKDLINYVMSIRLDNNMPEEYYSNMSFTVFTDSHNYAINIYVNRDQYNKICDMMKDDKLYNKQIDNYRSKNIYAITLFNNNFNVDKSSKLYKLILENYTDNKTSKVTDYSGLFDATLYVYEDYNVIPIDVRINDNEDICKLILDLYRNDMKKFIRSSGFDEVYSYDVGIDDKDRDFYYDDKDIIKDFIIKHINDDYNVDNYRYVGLFTDKSRHIFVTSKVEEFDTTMKNIRGYDDEFDY